MSHPVTPRSGQHHNEAQWEVIRSRFAHLYLVERKTLKQVMQILGARHGFWASVKMYKTHIEKWKLNKNNKERELLHVVRKIHEPGRDGKSTSFRIRGKSQSMEQVRDHFRRKGVVHEDDLLDRLPTSPTPSVLSFTTEEGTEPCRFDNAASFLGSSHDGEPLSPSERAMVPPSGTRWNNSTLEEPESSAPCLLAIGRAEQGDSSISQNPSSTAPEEALEIDTPFLNAVNTGDVLSNPQLYQSVTPPAHYERMEKLLFSTKDLCSSAFDHHTNGAAKFASVGLSQEFRLLFLQTRSSFDHCRPHQEALAYYGRLTDMVTSVLHQKDPISIVLIYQRLCSRRIDFQEPLMIAVIEFMSEMATIKLNTHNPVTGIIKSIIQNRQTDLESVELGARCALDYVRCALGPLHPYTIELADRHCGALMNIRRYDEAAERLKELVLLYAKELGKTSYHFCWTLISMGCCYEGLKDFDQARRAFEESFYWSMQRDDQSPTGLAPTDSNNASQPQTLEMYINDMTWLLFGDSDHRSISSLGLSREITQTRLCTMEKSPLKKNHISTLKKKYRIRKCKWNVHSGHTARQPTRSAYNDLEGWDLSPRTSLYSGTASYKSLAAYCVKYSKPLRQYRPWRDIFGGKLNE